MANKISKFHHDMALNIMIGAMGDLKQNREGHICHYNPGMPESGFPATLSAPLVKLYHSPEYRMEVTLEGARFILENLQDTWRSAREFRALNTLAGW